MLAIFSTMQIQLLFAFVLICKTSGAGKRNECVTPNQENASCVPLAKCRVIAAAVYSFDEDVLQFVERSKCGSGKGMVCCGTLAYLKFKTPYTAVSLSNSPPEEHKIILSSISDDTVCGFEAKLGNRIKGGYVAQLEDFPWVAALEYKSKLTEETVGIRCGGSLISNRYVLTAAHCIIHVEFVIIKAWLGVTNITSDENCLNVTGISQCARSIQKLNVKNTVVHPSYQSLDGTNDIGLLRLENAIERFTAYIRPVCLPSRHLPSPRIGIRLTVAGWGITETNQPSDIKLKVDVPVQNDSICNEFLKTEGRNVSSSQLCVGGQNGRDSCQGDSGGPLMNYFTNANHKIQWYQEAIVSYGVGCGINGRPAIYTRVSSYMSWIGLSVGRRIGDRCTTPNGEAATCVPVRACDAIIDALRTREPLAAEFAQQSQCGYDSEPLVCCGVIGIPIDASDFFDIFTNAPDSQNTVTNQEVETTISSSIYTNTLLDRTVCGGQKQQGGRIINGGEQTKFGEFPWMAALEYNFQKSNKSAGIQCGGSLINNRYVMTAAHCILTRTEIQLIKVWLGDWDISKDPDCRQLIATEECADAVQKIKIKKEIPHPFYSATSGNNDVGLLRLEHDIKYTGYIRPLCLPPSNFPTPPFGAKLTVAGWGATQNGTTTDIQLKVAVPLLPKNACIEAGVSADSANQLCAGGANASYSCQGDSGGPVMIIYKDKVDNLEQWYQEGIVLSSVGCGHEGQAIYTRVSKYTDWVVWQILAD